MISSDVFTISVSMLIVMWCNIFMISYGMIKCMKSAPCSKTLANLTYKNMWDDLRCLKLYYVNELMVLYGDWLARLFIGNRVISGYELTGGDPMYEETNVR